MSRPLLYAYSLSSCSWRVRIALAYKGIEHNIKLISLPKDETRTPEYLEINSAGQIPVLEVKGTKIAESIAIMEYLDEAYPDTKRLLPNDLLKRAKVREFCEILNSGIQPLQNGKVAKYHSSDVEKQKEWIYFYVNRGLTALEQIVRKTSPEGKYCFENNLTSADCCLVPQVYNSIEIFKMDMKPYPKITSIYEALMKLDAVKIGHPKNPL